jgi:carboxyl-terminal processing protease
MKIRWGIFLKYLASSCLAIPCLADDLQSASKKVLPKESSLGKMSEGELMRFFWRCMKLIRYQYIDDIDYPTLVEYALQGVLNNIDPQCMYFDRKEFGHLQESCKGSFGGIGVVISKDRSGMRVIACLDDTPAAVAGILPGDIIVAVNDNVLTPADGFTNISTSLRGFPGTAVKLSIDRKGETKILHFLIKRAVIAVKSVKYRIAGNVGIIRIANFDEQTPNLLKNAILDIQAKKKDQLHGYIIDLRRNPGGLVDEAVSCCQLFIDRGVLLRSKGRSGMQEEVKYAVPGLALIKKNTPVVVLIDSGSASASEMMAGALKDHNVAIILGTPSFGKGSTQTLFPLESSIGGAIKITTMRWYTPHGHPIQGHGITPHIVVNQIKSIEPISGDDFTMRESSYQRSLPSEPKKEGDGTPAPSAEPGKEGDDSGEKAGLLAPKTLDKGDKGDLNRKKVDQKEEKSDSNLLDRHMEYPEDWQKDEKYEKSASKELDYQMLRAEDLINGMHFFIQQQAKARIIHQSHGAKKSAKTGPDAGR